MVDFILFRMWKTRLMFGSSSRDRVLHVQTYVLEDKGPKPQITPQTTKCPNFCLCHVSHHLFRDQIFTLWTRIR